MIYFLYMNKPEQKTLEAYFQDFGISDPDKKMALITELNQMVYDRNEAIRKLDDESLEEYQQKHLHEEVAELDGYIQKTFEKSQ